jgi:ribosomal protein L36
MFKVVGNNPQHLILLQTADQSRCSCKESKKDKTMRKGVVYFICKLPPKDMQIRPKFSMDIVGLGQAFQ